MPIGQPTLVYHGVRADRQRELCGCLYAFCGTCGQPLEPCPAGGDDAVMHGPRYIGFYPCCPRRGDITMGSQHEPIYTVPAAQQSAFAPIGGATDDLSQSEGPKGAAASPGSNSKE